MDSSSCPIPGSEYSFAKSVIDAFEPKVYENMFKELAQIEYENIFARYDDRDDSPLFGRYASAWGRFSFAVERLLTALRHEKKIYNKWTADLQLGLIGVSEEQPPRPLNELFLGLTKWANEQGHLWSFARTMRILDEFHERKLFYSLQLDDVPVKQFINGTRLASLRTREQAQVIGRDFMAVEQNLFHMSSAVQAGLRQKMTAIGGSTMYRISVRADGEPVNFHLRNRIEPFGERINMPWFKDPSNWEPVYKTAVVYTVFTFRYFIPGRMIKTPRGHRVIEEVEPRYEYVDSVIHFTLSVEDLTMKREWSLACNQGQRGGLRDE